MSSLRPSLRVCRHTALALAISLGFAGAAQAQSAEGSLFGRATAGATVSIRNLDTGLQRQATAEAGGSFSFSKLPPGRYSVTSGGITREVVVAIGSGTEVKLTVQEIERIEISGRSARSSIDVTSVESNTVFTSEQMRTIPVARNVDAVALLAPGAVKGDPGLGNGGLASFGGASVGENGYYINGFDVTNIRNFLSYANLPFDAVEQQQIKNGGYGAEYGRSLGGVVSVLTKRGGNEWKAGAALYYKPDALRKKDPNVADLDVPDHAGGFTVFRNAWKQSDLTYTVYGGGPIIKDKLFVFGLIEGRHDTEDRFRQSTSTHYLEDKPKGLLKIDWSITDNHTLEYTGISNKKKTKLTDYNNAKDFSTSHDGAGSNSVTTEGADVNMLKYTGSLTQDLTVSAMVGRVRNKQPTTTGGRLDNQDCPVVLDTDLSEIGCWSKPFPGQPIRDPKSPPYDSDVRKAGRLDVEYQLGSHQLRAGYDAQDFKSVAGAELTYSGLYYYRYFVSASGTVNGVLNAVPKGSQYVRRRDSGNTGGSYDVKNTAFYVEDSWQLNRNWLLYGGLRSESFDNKNSDDVSFVKKDNLIAPRLGFAWNVNGDSSLKVFGNAGRYYIPVASNTNIRATRGEKFIQTFYAFNGRDPRTQAPLNLSAPIGTAQVINDGKLPDPATVADTNLKPMNQDEFILGFQKALSREYTFGAKVIHRKINDGMDDFCGGYAQKNWALDNGYTDFDASTLAPCMLLNPGRDVHLKMDLKSDGNLTAVTIPAKYFALAKYERTYNALELALDKPFDGRWGFNATYTWSKSRGTAEGYVQSTLQQEDAGLTQDFDFGSFTDGAKGYLPNDRRHVIKAYGTYRVADDWRVGGNLIIASGRPISCIGFVPETVPDFVGPDGATGSGDYTSASSYYCVNPKTGKSELVPRGSRGRTPWTGQLDGQVAWTPKLGNGRLTLQIDVFNIFNTQKVVRVNEVADYSRATTSAVEGKPNPNYLSPTDFQEGRSVLFTGRYEF